MKDYILNKIVLKNGDSLDIVESSTLPLPERIMYKMEHEKEMIIIRRDVGKMVIPIDNILFASSIPLDITSAVENSKKLVTALFSLCQLFELYPHFFLVNY